MFNMGGVNMATKKKVFISYSSRDRKEITWAIDLLKELGISYWIAPEMIPVGSNYAKEIPSAIRECDVFLLFVSKSSQASIWVEKELDSAINRRKNVVPVRIDPVPLEDVFHFYLNNVQTIPYFDNKEQGRKQLEEQLIELCGQDEIDGLIDEEKIIDGTRVGKRARTALDVFSMNPTPTNCEYCGGDLKKITVGTYQCLRCGRENYDYLQTVRNYLDRNGAKSAVVIAKETGVPRESVSHFLRQEFLEIPKSSEERLSCEKCGAPIRSGMYCERCKEEERRLRESNGTGWHSSLRRRL